MPLPDLHYLRRAEGWFELGTACEAEAELEAIAPEWCGHPEVLSLRWRIYVQAQNWEESLVLALSWTRQIPEDPRGWIALARTFYHRRQVRAAYVLAVAKSSEFVESWQLLFDTARYACLLGKHQEAEEYLHLALMMGDARAIKLMALEHPDLEGLRTKQIRPRRPAALSN